MSLAFILGLSPEKVPELFCVQAVCIYTFIQVNNTCCLTTQIPLVTITEAISDAWNKP